MNYVTYDANGKITQWASCPDSMFALQSPPVGQFHALGLGQIDTHHVVGGAITSRPANPAVLTGNHLSALPSPCTIFINDKSYACVDATCDLMFSRAGLLYKIRVEAFPFMDAKFQVQT